MKNIKKVFLPMMLVFMLFSSAVPAFAVSHNIDEGKAVQLILGHHAPITTVIQPGESYIFNMGFAEINNAGKIMVQVQGSDVAMVEFHVLNRYNQDLNSYKNKMNLMHYDLDSMDSGLRMLCEITNTNSYPIRVQLGSYKY